MDRNDGGGAGRLWPAAMPDGGEAFDELARAPGARIERIRSAPDEAPGPWYDQAGDEWVAVLAGEAFLTETPAGGPARTVRMAAGEWRWIPAGLRHRVERVAAPTVWLAVHFTGGEGGGANGGATG